MNSPIRAMAALLCAMLYAFPASASPATTGPGFAGRPRYEGTLTSEQAVSLALQHNLDVALGQAELDEAKADVLEASSMSRLKMTLGAYAARQDADMIYTDSERSFATMVPPPGALSLNAMAMLPIFNGGRLAARLRAARAEEAAALALLAARLRAAARSAREVHASVLLDRVALDTAEWEVQQLREAVRITQQRLEVGRVARYVLLRTEAEEARAAQERNDARARLAASLARLSTVLGVAHDSRLDPIGLPPRTPPPEPQETLLTRALQERPDVIAARSQLEAERQRVSEAQARYAPQLWGIGMFEALKADPLRATPFERGYSVGLAVSVPFVDGGERRAGVQAAQARRHAREAMLAQLEQEVAEQVITARAQMEAAAANLDLARTQLERADEDLRVARLRYESGRGLHLEILDALAVAARARLDQARAARDAAVAQADLLYATGGL